MAGQSMILIAWLSYETERADGIQMPIINQVGHMVFHNPYQLVKWLVKDQIIILMVKLKLDGD